ncbi:Hypothetical predicted protein [Pelobates cultripes]|uniref:Uncharacterized protein n=1 Tax=Pelobates cultripes TaxID=61616 RepID=A0AAD1RD57_PELCU|nr:Hypothetical predicted protein [Pelobates cultripes]
MSEPLTLKGDAVAPLEQLDSEEFHSLLDATMSRPPRKRATCRAKAARTWKRAKALSDSSDTDSDSEEVLNESDEIDSNEWEVSSPDHSPPRDPNTLRYDDADSSAILDPQGEPLFDPDTLQNPRSAEWFPTEHVARYIAARIRKPLDKATRNKLRAECPRPTVPDMASATPDIDPKVAQFLGKTGWKAKKGLDYSLRHCQDKVLDTLCPSAKIFELVEAALTEGTPLDLLAIRGWAQRSICLIGNANAALATERRKTILMKIEPKLVNMALTEPGPQAKGLLFGDNFVKELSTYVSTFTALDKAQTSIKRVFSPRVFGGAGRHRGRLPGRSSHGSYRGYRGPTTARFQPPENRAPSPFFPVRGRPWQPRGNRGTSYSRRPYGECNTFPLPEYTQRRGQTVTLYRGLATLDNRLLGSKYCLRVPHRVRTTPCPNCLATPNSVLLTRQGPGGQRDPLTPRKRRNISGSLTLPGRKNVATYSSSNGKERHGDSDACPSDSHQPLGASPSS